MSTQSQLCKRWRNCIFSQALLRLLLCAGRLVGVSHCASGNVCTIRSFMKFIIQTIHTRTELNGKRLPSRRYIDVQLMCEAQCTFSAIARPVRVLDRTVCSALFSAEPLVVRTAICANLFGAIHGLASAWR